MLPLHSIIGARPSLISQILLESHKATRTMIWIVVKNYINIFPAEKTTEKPKKSSTMEKLCSAAKMKMKTSDEDSEIVKSQRTDQQ